MEQDISREGISTKKITHTLKVITIKRYTDALIFANTFSDIDFDELFSKGKRGIILDVDDCIAPHHGDILEQNVKILETLLKKGWKIVIFSNMKKTPRYEVLENMGIQIITSVYAKPDIRGFEISLKRLELPAQAVVMIGDNFLTDGGAMNLGIDFIKVKPLGDENEKKSVARKLQILIRDIADNIADIRHKK